jgi:hypothetical protein
VKGGGQAAGLDPHAPMGPSSDLQTRVRNEREIALVGEFSRLPDALPDGLFEGFDACQVAAIAAAHERGKRQEGHARAQRQASRHHLRRANAEKQLAEILPARFEAGDSWHVISRGDIDALSYVRHALAGVSHFDVLALSTWCIARADLEEVAGWLDSGRVDRFELYAGEIFPSQYGDEHEMALRMVEQYGVRLVIARNHSKVTIAANEAEGYFLAIESSANVNTNPRIEQSAIHCSRELFDFYREFFHGLRSIDRRP